MSRELDAINARILADPDDDEPRLAAAELFDRDDPDRAEHIRIGVRWFRARLERALAQIEGAPLPPWPMEDAGRKSELEQEHGKRWAGSLGQREHCSCWLDRGFVGSVVTNGEALLAIPDAELAEHPIDALTLFESPAPLEDVLRLPLVRRISELSFVVLDKPSPRGADVEALVSWKPGERCVMIRVPCSQMPSLDRVLASPALRELGLLMLRDMDAYEHDGVWASARAAAAEAQYGLVPALRPRVVDPSSMTGRLVRELARRGLADRVIDRRPIAGTVRGIARDLHTTRHPTQEIFAFLHARGYVQDDKARLRYDYTLDAGPGWAGGVYSLNIAEHSDAPVADEIDRLMARPR